MILGTQKSTFYGWHVVSAAFAMAVFGWGIGFYGPPIFLSVVGEANGWSLGLVSMAVTLHFLIGAIVGANLPFLHRRFGIPAVTKAGALSLAVGVHASSWWPVRCIRQLVLSQLRSAASWPFRLLGSRIAGHQI